MEDHNFEESEEKLQEKGGVSALDNTLFAILKDLRKKIAKKNNLPPYVIFQDPSLEDMCTNYPDHVGRTGQHSGCRHRESSKIRTGNS